MATYASATNPFIKPNSDDSSAGARCVGGGGCGGTSNPQEASNKKNAPGMARLQNKKERKRARKKGQEQATESNLNRITTDSSTGGIDKLVAGENVDSSFDCNGNLLKSCCDGLVKPERDINNDVHGLQNLTGQVAELSVSEVIGLTDSAKESPKKLANGHAVGPGETIENTADDKSSSRTKDSKENIALDEDESNLIEGEDDGSGSKDGDSRRYQHIELIKKLRLQLRDLEKYAYERGELDQVPPSVLAERQTVILDSLKRKLALNIDEDRIEKLELEELKNQVDKEISELIDPLIIKDHLLNQLKTQLTDLERYTSHLHKTLGKSIDHKAMVGECPCQIHGCSTPTHLTSAATFQSLSEEQQSSSIMNNDTLPKTSKLIRSLMAQLICSDIKVQEAMKVKKDFSKYPGSSVQCSQRSASQVMNKSDSESNMTMIKPAPQFHDTAVWSMHIDRVQLATDSLTNLFGIEPGCKAALEDRKLAERAQVDESLVESVVRRQLIPALRELLAYGLIDPNSLPRPSYSSILFDPYYLISSLTCLPGSQSYAQQDEPSHPLDQIHVWNLVEDYFNSHNEPQFKTSSVKTLSQSFNLTPSMEGPIKVTSKQALLIAVDDIIELLATCKPNGPESHFKMFVYTALNQKKLASWIRIVFRSKSIMRKFYHNFSFVSQTDRMDKFLKVIDALSQIEFRLNTERGSVDQFVGAF